MKAENFANMLFPAVFDSLCLAASLGYLGHKERYIEKHVSVFFTVLVHSGLM